MKIWITDRWKTHGIEEAEVSDDAVIVTAMGRFLDYRCQGHATCYLRIGSDCHLDRAAAVAWCEGRRLKRIERLEAELVKLRAMSLVKGTQHER